MKRRLFFGRAAAGVAAAPLVASDLAQGNLGMGNVLTKPAYAGEVAQPAPAVDPKWLAMEHSRAARTRASQRLRAYRTGVDDDGHCPIYPDIEALRSVPPNVKRVWAIDRYRREKSEIDSFETMLRKHLGLPLSSYIPWWSAESENKNG